MKSIGERLRWAIEQYGPRPRGRAGVKGSIRGFADAMKAKGLNRERKGGSYQMIHRYLADETAPPEDFLRATIQILNRSGQRVRMAWLVDGSGEPTEDQHQLAEAGKGATTPDATRAVYDRALELIQEGLGITLPPEREWTGRHLLWQMFTRRAAAVIDRRKALGQRGETDIETIAREVGRTVRAPVDALGIRGNVIGEDYLLAMSLAIIALSDAEVRNAKA